MLYKFKNLGGVQFLYINFNNINVIEKKHLYLKKNMRIQFICALEIILCLNSFDVNLKRKNKSFSF